MLNYAGSQLIVIIIIIITESVNFPVYGELSFQSSTMHVISQLIFASLIFCAMWKKSEGKDHPFAKFYLKSRSLASPKYDSADLVELSITEVTVKHSYDSSVSIMTEIVTWKLLHELIVN